MENMILIEKNFSKLKEIIKKNKNKNIIYFSNDDDLNRKAIEKLNINGLMIPLENRIDFNKQRNSGFNEIFARIMKRKNMDLYIDFDELYNSNEKHKILSRIIQNLEICKKNKVQIKFYIQNIKKSDQEIRSLFSSIGAPTWMLKNCINKINL